MRLKTGFEVHNNQYNPGDLGFIVFFWKCG